MRNKKLEFTFLSEFDSVREGILEIFKVSKSQLKKYKMSRPFLEGRAKRGMNCKVPLALANHGEIFPKYTGSATPQVLLEDQDIIALSKPVKVHCHPLSYDEGDNLLSYLCEQNKHQELQINRENYDRGLLYRLDFETSGLILYAKDQDLYEQARKDIGTLIKEKAYLAIVKGESQLSGLLEHKMSYGGEKNKKAFSSESGMEVSCIVETLAYNIEKDCSLVKLSLHQGRRHQLRFQMAQAGHAILGDPLYGDGKEKRLYLHSYHYQILLNNEIKDYQDKSCDLFFNFFDLDRHL